MSLWLDVGCGTRPRGDVNVDLYLEPKHRRHSNTAIDPRNVNNFVRADAHHLPLRDGVFDRVESRQLIEHLGKPLRFIREAIRVSRSRVIIECPHRLHSHRSETHIHFFNAGWFREALRSLGVNKYKVKTVYRWLPHRVIPLIRWPLNIRVEVWLSSIPKKTGRP